MTVSIWSAKWGGLQVVDAGRGQGGRHHHLDTGLVAAHHQPLLHVIPQGVQPRSQAAEGQHHHPSGGGAACPGASGIDHALQGQAREETAAELGDDGHRQPAGGAGRPGSEGATGDKATSKL
ncbi:MAG: hypothetical protein M3535_03025 [Actinomycetota bacterium]|nr:hypothetical protein [Actinomycetota bacterium]